MPRNLVWREEDFMKAKLPIVTRDEVVDGKRVFEYSEKEVEINTSLLF